MRLRAEVEQLHREADEAEKHFQRVLDNQLGFVAVLDPDGRLRRTDRVARELAGVEIDEVYGKPFWEGSWWSYDDAVRDRIRASCEAASRGEKLRFDVDAAIEAGILPVDFQVAPIFDDAGRITHLVASGVDITSRRQVESVLREQRERLRLALEVGEIGVVDHDLRGERVVYDERGRRIHGFATKDVSLKEAYERTHPDDRDAMRENVREACARTGPDRFEVEYRIHHPETGTRWLSSRGRVLRDDGGTPVRYMGVLADITGLKQAEDQLRAANQNLELTVARRTRDLEAVNQQLEELSRTLTLAEQRERQRLSLVLHEDLQQLLYGLQMRVSVLEMQLAEPPETVGEVCSVIVGPLADMRRLCDQAVDLTRTLSVELDPPVLKDEGLAAALRWLASHVRERYELDVELDCDLGDAWVGRDVRLLLVQAVRELLFNIVHHADTPRARVSARVIEGILTLIVADGGAGFDVEQARTRLQQEHAGLGLFTVEERLRFVGARVRVASQRGTGTEVTITYALDTARQGIAS